MKDNVKKHYPYYSILITAIGICLLYFSPLHAQEKTARWSVITRDSLITEADSMYIRGAELMLFHRGKDSSAITIDSIRQINELTHNNTVVRSAITGGTVLGMVGFIAGRLLDTETDETVYYYPYFQVIPGDKSNLTPYLAAGGLIAGSVIGGVLGSKWDEIRSYPLGSMTAEERKSRLSSLLEPEQSNELWEQRPIHVALNVARVFPLGDFSDAAPTNRQSGAANPGLSARLEVFRKFNRGLELVGSLNHAVNSVDPAVFGLPYALQIAGGTWHTTWVLAGPRFPVSLSPTTTLYAGVEAGAFIGSSPEVDFTLYGVNIRQESSSAVSWGVGFEGGLRLANRLVIEGRYLFSEPNYTIRATAGNGIITEDVTQPTAMFQISVGVIGW